MKKPAALLAAVLTVAALASCSHAEDAPKSPATVTVTQTPTATATPSSEPSEATPEPSATEPQPTPDVTVSTEAAKPPMVIPPLSDSQLDQAFSQTLAESRPGVDPATAKFLAKSGCKLMDSGKSPAEVMNTLLDLHLLSANDTGYVFGAGTVAYCQNHLQEVMDFVKGGISS